MTTKRGNEVSGRQAGTNCNHATSAGAVRCARRGWADDDERRANEVSGLQAGTDCSRATSAGAVRCARRGRRGAGGVKLFSGVSSGGWRRAVGPEGGRPPRAVKGLAEQLARWAVGASPAETGRLAGPRRRQTGR